MKEKLFAVAFSWTEAGETKLTVGYYIAKTLAEATGQAFEWFSSYIGGSDVNYTAIEIPEQFIFDKFIPKKIQDKMKPKRKAYLITCDGLAGEGGIYWGESRTKVQYKAHRNVKEIFGEGAVKYTDLKARRIPKYDKVQGLTDGTTPSYAEIEYQKLIESKKTTEGKDNASN